MRYIYVMPVLVLIMTGFVLASTGGSPGPYGLTDTCVCTGSVPTYCSDDWVEISDNSVPGTPYMGTPLLLDDRSTNCCAAGFSYTMTSGTADVDVGTFSGSISMSIGFPLPAGIGIDASGEVTAGGSTTRSISYSSATTCGHCTCCAHVGKAGPQMTDLERTVTYDHRCWGMISGLGCGDAVQITCGHHTGLTASATLSYASAVASTTVNCGVVLTQTEKNDYGTNCN